MGEIAGRATQGLTVGVVLLLFTVWGIHSIFPPTARTAPVTRPPMVMSVLGMSSLRLDSPPMDVTTTSSTDTASMCSMPPGSMKMGAMDMASKCSTHGASATAPVSQARGNISVTQLTGPRAAAHIRTFTLVARPAHLSVGHGASVDAWTFNGTAPGPVLRVTQGDLVIVHLVNRLPVATTIHWHGLAVPNAEDGVAGSTQDAVAPGHSYTYRFIANASGTYWYHSHQDSLTQVARGLYGMLVIEPKDHHPSGDVDATIVLHEWQIGPVSRLAINDTIGLSHIAVRPGAWVRLRLLNTDNTLHVVTITGAPFTVAALDGHDIYRPQQLVATVLPLGSAQRYDVRFRMPEHGCVSLRLGDDMADDATHGPIATHPIAIIGDTDSPAAPAGQVIAHRWFDLTTYGQARPGTMTLHSHADAYYTLRLGAQTTLDMLHPNPTFTINGLASPNTTPIMVREGEVVRLHIVNETRFVHPMHLHGHTMVVLARNGRQLTGSPIVLDTVAVFPGESYDVAFIANNPGIWMLHCHNMVHARFGMMLMVMYDHFTTPYKDGGPAGNISD